MERLIYNIDKREPPKIDTDPIYWWDHIDPEAWERIVYLTRAAGITQDFNALMDLYDGVRAK